MTKNPLLNAGAAGLYITGIGLLMNLGMRMAPKEDTILAPIAMISLFTLSAAVMGYLFCYTPIVLYFDGKKRQAVRLFLDTVAVFAIITFIALGLLFTGTLR